MLGGLMSPSAGVDTATPQVHESVPAVVSMGKLCHGLQPGRSRPVSDLTAQHHKPLCQPMYESPGADDDSTTHMPDIPRQPMATLAGSKRAGNAHKIRPEEATIGNTIAGKLGKGSLTHLVAAQIALNPSAFADCLRRPGMKVGSPVTAVAPPASAVAPRTDNFLLI